MKIAVTYENGQVFQHFGHCENFKIYDVNDGMITDSQVVSAAGSSDLRRHRRWRKSGSG